MCCGSGPAMKNISNMPPSDLKVIAGVGCNTTSVKKKIKFGKFMWISTFQVRT